MKRAAVSSNTSGSPSPRKRGAAAGSSPAVQARTAASVGLPLKLVTSGLEWDKDELLDVIFWIRQLLSICIGLVWGMCALRGWPAILGCGGIQIGFQIFYLGSVLQIDEEDFGGRTEILKEGGMSAFALFMLSWIISYSALHFP
eukprot:Nk52_evm1s2290 gene=Nk52_evmTU1s2290